MFPICPTASSCVDIRIAQHTALHCKSSDAIVRAVPGKAHQGSGGSK